MHARSIALIVVLANMAVAQSIVTSSDKNFAAAPRPLVKQDGTTEETMRGVWRARGYGYLAHVDEKEVRLYNETNSILWQQTDVDASDLLVSVSDDGKQARLITHRDVPPFVVDRIASMPAGKRVPDEWTPTMIYTAFAETMSERYGFFKERSFNWAERLNEFEPKINNDMNEMQLFEIISQSLLGLEDAHVQLGATIDGSPQRAMLGTPDTLKRGMELFEKQTEFSDFQSYLDSRVQALEAGIAGVVLAGKPKQSCEQLTWGTTKNNVGYIHIAGMAGFSDAETVEGQTEELHTAMEQILKELSTTRALIVDVSTNGGGRDLFSRTLAAHFADQRRLAFTKGPWDATDIRHSVYVEPFERNGRITTYTKPIYLVVSDITLSAAEIFVLCMKDFPHVTVVGQRTRGALSDVLSKTLPNGWAFGLSNELYLDSQGVCFEAKGIAPDMQMVIIDPTKPDLGHAKAILRIADRAK